MSGFWEILVVAALAQLAVLPGEKVQFIIAGLSTRYNPLVVVAAAGSAFAGWTALEILFGNAIQSVIPGLYLDLITAALFVVFAVLLWRLEPPGDVSGERELSTAAFARLLRTPSILGMGVAMILVGGIEGSIFTWLPYYSTEFVGRQRANLLLSTFLLKEGGASAALAVDRDPAILAAAAKVAEAFGVHPVFAQIDFDCDPHWEQRLLAFQPDVVVALSVLHWVQDKARFLAFLSRFDEVVFEGHDSSRTERDRLRRAGFAEIDLVDTSERGRPILVARKR
jgi:hypothetical protein